MSDEHVTHGAWLSQRTPDLTGPGGEAWRITLRPQTPAETGGVAVWLVHAPHAHAFWSYYAMSVVHLRPIPGVKPAHRVHDDVTHELLVLALDPGYAPPDPMDWRDMHYLTPADVVEQFQVPDDTAATRLLEAAVRTCCRGVVSPDQDYRSWWRGAIAKTAAHERGEHSHG